MEVLCIITPRYAFANPSLSCFLVGLLCKSPLVQPHSARFLPESPPLPITRWMHPVDFALGSRSVGEAVCVEDHI